MKSWKKALGKSTLDIKILKKKLEWINNETRNWIVIQEFRSEYAIRTITILGVENPLFIIRPQDYPERKRTASENNSGEQMKGAILEIMQRVYYWNPKVKAFIKSDDLWLKCDQVQWCQSVYERRRINWLAVTEPEGASSHTRQIAVEGSKHRWASDITSIKCWKWEKSG